MEPPEDSFPRGLSWPQFRSLYAKSRQGAGTEEVSRAWESYKVRMGRIPTPATTTTRRTSPKRSGRRTTKVSGKRKSPRRASPVRSITDPLNLGNLPREVLTNIASQGRGAAAVLAQLSRRTHAAAVGEVKRECDKDVSTAEMRRVILANLTRLRTVNYEVSYGERGLPLLTNLTIFSYVAIGETRAIRHIYDTDGREGTMIRIAYSTQILSTTASGLNGRRIDGEWKASIDSHDEIAARILSKLDEEANLGMVVIPDISTVKAALSARGGCPKATEGRVDEYIVTRMRAILFSLGNEVVGREFLERREWAHQDRQRVAHALVPTSNAVDRASRLRAIMTILALSSRHPIPEKKVAYDVSTPASMRNLERMLISAVGAVAYEIGIVTRDPHA